MTTTDDATRSWLDRLIELGRRLHRPLPPRTRSVLLGVAGLAFVVGAWFAFRSLEVDLADVQWVPLGAAMLLGVPATAVVNGAEYLVSARVLDHRVRLRDALTVSVMGTAANMLPVPGSTMVRVQSLKQQGSGYGVATAATIAIGVAWVGVSSAIAGGLLLATGRRGLAALAFSAGGAGLLLLVPVLLARCGIGRDRLLRWTGVLVGVEVVSVATQALRLYLVLLALGAETSVTSAVVLAVSASVAAAAGVFPGGLGLREVLAAAFAPVVGLAPAVGFAVTAVNRVIGIVVHAPISIGLVVAQRRRASAAAATEPGDPPHEA